MVCVYVSYLLSHCMQPKGLWQRLAAALSDNAPIIPPLNTQSKSCPRIHESHTGASRQRKRKRKRRTQTPNKTSLTSTTPTPYSSISSEAGPTSTSTSASPTPPRATGVSTSGALSLGDSAAPSALRSLRGGGGDFHPLASWRADLLAVQASARDPWGWGGGGGIESRVSNLELHWASNCYK